MRRKSLIILCAMLIFASACQAQPSAEVSEEIPEQESIQSLALDSVEAESVAQRIERLDIQDVQAEMFMQLEMLSDNMNVTIESDTELAYSASNNGLHVVIDTIVNGKEGSASQLDVYADGEYLYLRTNYDTTWHKFTYANQTIDPESLIKMYTTTEFRQFYDEWQDRLVVTETDTEYTITLEGSGTEFTDYVRQSMNSLQGLRVDDALFEIYRVKNVKVVHTFDKANNLPTSMSISLNYLFRGESANVEHILDMNVNYLSVNQGFVLDLPSELETLELEVESP